MDESYVYSMGSTCRIERRLWTEIEADCYFSRCSHYFHQSGTGPSSGYSKNVQPGSECYPDIEGA